MLHVKFPCGTVPQYNVTRHRQPVSLDNPLLKWQGMISDAMIAGLDQYRDLRDRNMEQLFLTIYGSPALQLMLGLSDSNAVQRAIPSMEPEHAALIEQRIAELKAGMSEGGAREVVIRALLYIGMAGSGADERSFNELRLIRAEHGGLSLAEFKHSIREQYFCLLLDREGAIAAIPKMLPAAPATRAKMMNAIQRIVQAAGPLNGEHAQRLAEIEAIFDVATTAN